MPWTSSPRRARDLSLWLSLLLAMQAAGGLWIPGLYRDNSWIVATYRATDVLALFLVAPALAASAVAAFRGSKTWEMVRLGLVYKVFYNNLYFLVGTAFNRFFLLYVGITVLSGWALLEAILRQDPLGSEAGLGSVARRRGAAGILFGSALLLLALWVGQFFQFLTQGILPGLIASTGGQTHLVAALDLTTIVPLMLLGAWRLWRKEAWGVVISAAMLVQGLSITFDLLLASPFQARAGIADAWIAFPLWCAMCGGFALGTLLVLLPGSERKRMSRLAPSDG